MQMLSCILISFYLVQPDDVFLSHVPCAIVDFGQIYSLDFHYKICLHEATVEHFVYFVELM